MHKQSMLNELQLNILQVKYIFRYFDLPLIFYQASKRESIQKRQNAEKIKESHIKKMTHLYN